MFVSLTITWCHVTFFINGDKNYIKKIKVVNIILVSIIILYLIEISFFRYDRNGLIWSLKTDLKMKLNNNTKCKDILQNYYILTKTINIGT